MAGHRGGGTTKIIGEGYVLKKMKRAPYKFSANIVASRERIFPLFLSLSRFVGFPCMAVLETHLEDPYVVYSSKVCTNEEALDVFKEHSFQLVNDGFTSFGLASEQFEVFVGDHKDFQIFCNSKQGVMEVLAKYGIPKRSKLDWVGTGQHYHAQLGALFTKEIREMSEPLPAEEIEKHGLDPDSYLNFHADVVEKLNLKVDTYRASEEWGP